MIMIFERCAMANKNCAPHVTQIDLNLDSRIRAEGAY